MALLGSRALDIEVNTADFVALEESGLLKHRFQKKKRLCSKENFLMKSITL